MATTLGPVQKYQRARKIAALRGQGVVWREVAQQVGLKERQAQEILKAYEDENEGITDDPMDVVGDTIDHLTYSRDQAARTLSALPEDSPARATAAKTVMEIAIKRLELMQLAGMAPRSLSAPSTVAELRSMFAEFMDILNRHQVPTEVIHEMIARVETRVVGTVAGTSRVLPSPVTTSVRAHGDVVQD